jgi:hypothetical protein
MENEQIKTDSRNRKLFIGVIAINILPNVENIYIACLVTAIALAGIGCQTYLDRTKKQLP